MLELYQVGLIAIAVLCVLIALAARSWVKKANTQNIVLAMPQFSEFVDDGDSGSYVATTFAGRPLDRVSAHGLAYAGKARVLVDDKGVQISRTGEKSFLIGKASLLSVSRSSAVIDKAVEKDGLLSLRWKLGESEVETHLRFTSAQSRDFVATGASELLRSIK